LTQGAIQKQLNAMMVPIVALSKHNCIAKWFLYILYGYTDLDVNFLASIALMHIFHALTFAEAIGRI
jgi:hypothetical protein